MKKKAVIFPGVGYTKDKPLLYYAGKIAKECGYELSYIEFSGIEWSRDKLRDPDFLKQMEEVCLKKTEDAIVRADIGPEDELVFISKSIGTVAATAYAKRNALKPKQICFSPLVLIEPFVEDEGAVLFYGDSDPLADHLEIERIAKEKELEAHRIAGGNHSLETGDTAADLENMKSIMDRVSKILK